MSFTITKRFTFAAAHHLPQLQATHKCHRPHGHNYAVTVELAGELDAFGFVEDYGELADVRTFLDTTFDHRDLNNVVDFPPTAERLARYLFEVFCKWHPKLVAVTVAETENTTATYRPLFQAGIGPKLTGHEPVHH